jgi:hypothetical protein
MVERAVLSSREQMNNEERKYADTFEGISLLADDRFRHSGIRSTGGGYSASLYSLSQ